MNKTFTKRLILFTLCTLFAFTAAYAQTITVGTVDPGPYTPGSTIAVPISINDAAGCIGQGNIFNLYLSDASGNFAPGTLIGSYTGFYTSFVNGLIPATVLPGAGYKVMVKSTSPAVTSTISTAFFINAGAAVTAGVSSQIISPTYPEVYGQCNGTANSSFVFTNTSTAGATATATFINEQTKTTEANNINIPVAGYTFNANTANYTVIAKAKSAAGTVGTHAYLLINNVVNTTIGSTNSQTVCLINGKGDLTVNIDISSPTGIQYNYPGNLYNFTWGDGSPATVLTFCQIKALNGQVTHTFVKSACGVPINFQASNAYCGNIGSPKNSNASVVTPPQNIFKLPPTACAGTAIPIKNESDPGTDPSTCAPNAKALYTWSLDGVPYQNYQLSQPFNIPANTPPGLHKIILQLQNGSTGCTPADIEHDICLQAPPKPDFTLQTTACLSNGPVMPTNTSFVDPGCNSTNQYIWAVVGPASVTYAGGTNASSQTPQFVFTTPGVYSVTLSITTPNCGNVIGPTHNITVDGAPVVTLSGNTTICGNGQTLIFDNTAGSITQTVLSGTGQAQPTTYTWTVTGGTYSFQNNTTANSQYPIILFNDYAAYTVSVTQTNNCGTLSKSQKLTFVQSPTITLGAVPPVCASSPTVSLSAQITGAYQSFQWVGGTGTFSAGRSSKITNYTPSAAEINAGTVTLTFQVATGLPAPCDIIIKNVTITIIPIDNITSSPAPPPICTGQSVNYPITASDPISTFTWTAAVTSGTATGVAATGSGPTINDVITNTDPNKNAVVTYKITPQNGLCTGAVFTLTVTVNPLPVIKAAAVSASICSNQPANITLTSNIINTSYTWTSTAPANISGNTNQTSAVSTGTIPDVLINNGTAPEMVNYIITPYNGTCPGKPVTASIMVQPLPVTAKAGPNPTDEVCSTTTYTLQGNDPSPGTGLWTFVSGPGGYKFSDPTQPNATVSGLIEGNTYQFRWTITAAPTCPPSTDAITIVIDKATIGGTTSDSGNGPVCSGSNAGQITLAGQQGNIVRWESSIDNGTTWQHIVNVSGTQSYSNLTQTTQYRAIVQSGVCLALPSTVTAITVNPITITAVAGNDQPLCNQTSTTLDGNDATPFVGTWTQTAGPFATIVNIHDPKTHITGLTNGNIYTFMWTIKGLPPCSDSKSSVNISTAGDITASFTTDKTQGCGSTTVTFTNTSAPNTAGMFLWDFGDGTTSTAVTPPPHTFAPAPAKDITYTVTLTPVSNCNLKTPFPVVITISPTVPVASLVPSQTAACGAFTLTVQNTSPGDNAGYDFYLADNNGVPLQHIHKPDKSDAVFQPVNPTKITDYQVYIIATDKCGNQNPPRPITISASPSSVVSLTQIKGDPQSVCLGNSITLQNLSSGGDHFTYTIYDSNKKPITTIPAGTADLVYTPTAVGTYYVSIIAGNNGCGDAPESPLKEFTVYVDPTPDFTFTLDNEYNVTFKNTTPADGNTPPESLSYLWDFGDGSAKEGGFVPKKHLYDYNNSPFTATLTATNAASGCFGVATHTIIVNFLGGLYLPNAFVPSSPNSELKIFKAKGNSIKEWHMQIFNNFGQLLWETTKLDSNGSPVEGWDGTYKGIPVEQGVYVWQISATLINGQQWKGMSYNHSLPKRTGIINLIR